MSLTDKLRKGAATFLVVATPYLTSYAQSTQTEIKPNPEVEELYQLIRKNSTIIGKNPEGDLSFVEVIIHDGIKYHLYSNEEKGKRTLRIEYQIKHNNLPKNIVCKDESLDGKLEHDPNPLNQAILFDENMNPVGVAGANYGPLKNAEESNEMYIQLVRKMLGVERAKAKAKESLPNNPRPPVPINARGTPGIA